MLIPNQRSFLRALLTLAAAFAIHAGPEAQAQPASLPARLTDAEFWKLIEDVSEPGGYFRSDNFLSNETMFQYVIPSLERVTRPGHVYLGVGPEQNFTYIAALKPSMAIIFDIRRGNLHMHLLYKALFELSADRAEFVSRLFSKPRPAGLDSTASVDSIFNAFWVVDTDTALYKRNLQEVTDILLKKHGFALSADDVAGIRYVYDAFYYGGPRMDYNHPNPPNGRMPSYADLMVQYDGTSQRSYLASERNWRTLKEMHLRNLIVPVVGDFGGPKAIRAVGTWLRERNATVQAFYTSNVEQYLFQSYPAWRNYYENVATLPLDSSSVFIRSNGGFGGGRGGGLGNTPNLYCAIQDLLAAYKAGRINAYMDVLQMSR